jgi:hypothetical protein
MWVSIFYQTFVFWEELSEIWSKTYMGFHVKYPLFLSDFNEALISQQIFEKYSNMKFHENPSSGSCVVACRKKDGQTRRS